MDEPTLADALVALGFPPTGDTWLCIRGNQVEWRDGIELVSPADLETKRRSLIRDWAGFALAMNQNPEWRSLVRTNGAAAMLANYVRDRDMPNARIYYQDLLAAGDLSPTLQAAIATAAEQCNLTDLLQQLAE